MQTERSLPNELKFQYQSGGAHIRLIFINAAVFLFIGMLHVIERLTGAGGGMISSVVDDIFTLQTDFSGFLHKPWGLVTNIFTHYGFLHFLLNMLFLYSAGSMFLRFFSSKRLMHVYIVGGIAGGLFEIAAHAIFPGVQSLPVVGASGAIMAIFIALAFYRPSLRISLFNAIEVPVILIAGIFLVSNLVDLGSNDNVAHFAHIGGALVGILSVQNLHSSTNIINSSERFEQAMRSFFSRLFKPKSRLRVEKGGRTAKTDEQYNAEAKIRQKKLDVILDKISKSGYESLTKAEKEFLFTQSKR